MIEKIECACIEAYKSRKMRDPNCCACSCDHNDLVEQLAKANERVKELSNEILETYEYETEYDGRVYSLCIHCGEDMEHTGVHHELCIVRQLRKEQGE